MCGQRHALALLSPGKTRYLFYRRLVGPQGQSGGVRKISPPPEFDLWTIQPVASQDVVERGKETQLVNRCTSVLYDYSRVFELYLACS